jgi:hypothetical protein
MRRVDNLIDEFCYSYSMLMDVWLQTFLSLVGYVLVSVHLILFSCKYD